MQAKTNVVAVWEICYESGNSEIKSFTKKEFASFRRSKLFKTILTRKRLCEISVTIKTR